MGGPYAHNLHTHILTLQLGRAVGDGSRPGEELDGERGLHAPHERDGDPRPLHRDHPGHRGDSAPVLEEPGVGWEHGGEEVEEPCSTSSSALCR